jgi:hypothetical protein
MPGELVIEPLGGVIGDAGQYINKPDLWINVVHPGGDDQAVHHCRPPASAIRTGEQP